ncbi:MAG TPA: phosphoribosylformylglycinamidine synthase, partial [Leeuwenhoekiella sp.]|nr:phosphoribosylformylglycinamidine synthase [Leeuwenhoekiella sp.]
MKRLQLVLLLAVLTHFSYAQETEPKAITDSLYIAEVEE